MQVILLRDMMGTGDSEAFYLFKSWTNRPSYNHIKCSCIEHNTTHLKAKGSRFLVTLTYHQISDSGGDYQSEF